MIEASPIKLAISCIHACFRKFLKTFPTNYPTLQGYNPSGRPRRRTLTPWPRARHHAAMSDFLPDFSQLLMFSLVAIPALLFWIVGLLLDIRRVLLSTLQKITEDSDSGETVSWLREIHQELKDINMNTDREVYTAPEDCGWTESIGDADPEGDTVDPCSENLTGKENEKSE